MTSYDIAHQLVTSVRDSEQYKEFINMKEKLKQDDENCELVKKFQIKQLEIKKAQFYQKEVTQNQKKEYETVYSVLRANPVCRQYLDAEFQISRLLSDIQRILGEVEQEAAPIGLENLKFN